LNGGINLDIKQLRYFLQICKDESFSKAAKNLYITQQGLSRAIKSLEESVQAPLFYRKVNGVELTEHGRYLKNQSVHILDQFDSFLNDISKMSYLEPEKLSVGFSMGVLNALSTDLISDFQEAYPRIELAIKEFPDYYCEKAVLNGELDIALAIGPIDKSKFHSKVVKTQYPCALVNEKNPLSQKSVISFEDLKNENFIITNENFKMYHNFVNKCKQAGFEPNIILSTAEIHLVHKLSRLNKGLGISVDFVVTDINYPNVHSLPFADETFLWEINLIYKKDSFLSGAGRIFSDYVMKY
jgi:DNA-binding transcriptional LysR family regulator